MSEDDKPGDVVSFLVAFGRRLFHEARGDSGSPVRTAVVRLAVLLVVLVCAGPILWQALLSMPTPLWVFIGLVIVGRIGLWLWRRSRP